jgi:hypothetical protein
VRERRGECKPESGRSVWRVHVSLRCMLNDTRTSCANKRGKARSGPGLPVDVDDHTGCCAVFARAGPSPSLSFSPRLCLSCPSNFSKAMIQAIVACLGVRALLSPLDLLPPSSFASCSARHIRSDRAHGVAMPSMMHMNVSRAPINACAFDWLYDPRSARPVCSRASGRSDLVWRLLAAEPQFNSSDHRR